MQRGGTVDQWFGLVVVAAVVVTAVILAVVLMFLGGYVIV
jgi:ABC-type transport system involved in cytochrome bd biosynthesis fused ATPase/permease subunit